MKTKLVGLIQMMLLFMTGCSLSKSISLPVPEPAYWPTSGWQTSTPEAQGMDSERLAGMFEDISANNTNIYSAIVIRNGYLVAEAYFPPYTRDTKVHIQSVTKSVIGALVGKAIGAGQIKSANETMLSYFPNQAFANPSAQKDAIQLKHLLAMSSGFDCQEFSSSGPKMEQSSDWVQFMLDLPVTAAPGNQFGYCNGNAHLLSAVLEKAAGMDAREYANQELFGPLGISPVDEMDWGSDPQGMTTGGYGLHLTSLDMAKLAMLYLQNGKWEGKQILPAAWVAASTTQQVSKEDGSGYGYLWTVYPKTGHYAALGLGGQQIHVYPARNLIVIVTAGLNAAAEVPEIEKMLNKYILPAARSGFPLKENTDALTHLQTAIEKAENPLQPAAKLPETAEQISGKSFAFAENPVGWQEMELVFEPNANTAQIILNSGPPIKIGLDNIYRLSNVEPFGELWLRGSWIGDQAFVIDYPYSFYGAPKLGELAETEIQLNFNLDQLEVKIVPVIFGGETIAFTSVK